MDGKQRLSSVRAFIEGDIPVMDANGVKWSVSMCLHKALSCAEADVSVTQVLRFEGRSQKGKKFSGPR